MLEARAADTDRRPRAGGRRVPALAHRPGPAYVVPVHTAAGPVGEDVTGDRRRVRNLLIAAMAAGLLAACGETPASPAPASPPPAGAAGSHLSGVGLEPVPATSPGGPTWTPWPAAMHDARHSGVAAGDGPRTGRVRWHRSLESTGGGRPGAGGRRHDLHGHQRRGAARRRSRRPAPTGGPTTRSARIPTTPICPSRRWCCPTGRCCGVLRPTIWLPCPRPGLVLWTQPLPGRATSPTTTNGRRVYVGDTGGGVSALDVAAGGHRLAWTVDVGTTSYGSVVTDGSGRLYTTADTALIALDDQGATGRIAWRADPGDGISEVSAGLAADGTALLGHERRPRVGLSARRDPELERPGRDHLLLPGRHRRWVRLRRRPRRTGAGGACRGRLGRRELPARAAPADLELRRGRPGPSAVLRHPAGTPAGRRTRTGRCCSTSPSAARSTRNPALTADGALIVGDRDGRADRRHLTGSAGASVEGSVPVAAGGSALASPERRSALASDRAPTGRERTSNR